MPTQNQSRFDEILEEFDSIRDKARIDAERVHRSRLASIVPLLEHYREGRASWVFDMDPPFERADIDRGRVCSGTSESLMDFSILLHANVANRGIVNHWSEKPVLVSHVHNVHGPDGEIPSIVWLYLAQKKPEKVGRENIYLQLPQLTLKQLRSGINGKLCSLPVSSGNQPLDRFQPDIIEGALEIVDGIPNEYRKPVEGISILRASKVALDVFESTVRIYMGRDSQSVFQKVDAALKVRDVMLGPVDLETCTLAYRHAESRLPHAIQFSAL